MQDCWGSWRVPCIGLPLRCAEAAGLCVCLLCQGSIVPASSQAKMATRLGLAEAPRLCAGHYPHHHRLDLDLQGNGGVFGGDGAGESAPPVPMKLPPEHLFTCTVGRNRSQARRGPKPPGHLHPELLLLQMPFLVAQGGPYVPGACPGLQQGIREPESKSALPVPVGMPLRYGGSALRRDGANKATRQH